MTDTGLDPSQLPSLAHVTDLRAHTRTIRSCGSKVEATTTSVDTHWKKLKLHFVSADTQTLVSALSPNLTRGDSVKSDASKAAKALENFANTEEQLVTKKSTLITDIESFKKDIEGDEGWTLNPVLVGRQKDLLKRMNELVAEHNNAERICANAITALYGGTQYKETPNQEDPVAGNGQKYYGYSKKSLDEISSGAAVPWGKAADWWDLSWSRQFFGTHPLGSYFAGNLQGLMNMGKGLYDLAAFHEASFGPAWKGLGTFALDLAVLSRPEMARYFSGPQAPRAEPITGKIYSPQKSAERAVETFKSLINLDEWKKDPAYASGMTSVDVASLLIPGGAGAVTKPLKAASSFGRFAAKMGDASLKLGVPANIVKKMSDLTVNPVMKAAHALNDTQHGFRQVGYRTTESLSVGSLRVHQGMAKAQEWVQNVGARTQAKIEAGVKTAGDLLTHPGKYFDYGGLRRYQYALPQGPHLRGASVADHLKIVFSEKFDAAAARTPSGGHLPSPNSPEPSWVRFNRMKKWNLGEIMWREGDKKILGLNEANKLEKLFFLDPKEIPSRTIKRSKTLEDFDLVVNRMNMPDEVRKAIFEEIQTLKKQRSSGELFAYEEGVILRKHLDDYDIDHKVDLQLGGKDLEENLQWLHKSANRSIGAQLRHRRKFFILYSEENKIEATPIAGFIFNENQ